MHDFTIMVVSHHDWDAELTLTLQPMAAFEMGNVAHCPPHHPVRGWRRLPKEREKKDTVWLICTAVKVYFIFYSPVFISSYKLRKCLNRQDLNLIVLYRIQY